MKIRLLVLPLLAATAFAHAGPPVWLDTVYLGKQLGGGFSKKGNQASEYKSAGSNYRTWKPTTSKTPSGGLFVSTKLDHIRRMGGDDHAFLEMTFGPDGKIISTSATMKIGDKSLKTGIITAATIGVTGPAGIILGPMAEFMHQTLGDQIAKFTDNGGRTNFVSVVTHNFNMIAQHVIVGTKVTDHRTPKPPKRGDRRSGG